MAFNPEDISKRRDSAESFINSLVDDIRNKRWVKILLLIGVVCLLFLNPAAISLGLTFLKSPSNWSLPTSYLYVWLITVFTIFVAAFLIALSTKKHPVFETPATATSIIKGLLPYTKEDAEWFAKLQRGNILHECMSFCLGADATFAILSGESGAGKTSFLQAGLFPNLEQQGQRPIYVKITDSQPLDSIRQLLDIEAEEPTVDENRSLVEILRQTTRNAPRPIVLILDQFEQFFAHNKSKSSRRPFIQQMAEWHKQSSSLHVKILISIRGDFTNRMNEFQNEMKYILTPHNNLALEKFDPQEAANVFRVIAKESKIEVDEDFIKELTKHELSDREDGTVSPVDVQILSRMIDGQKGSEERVFNRKAFQKLGGVEGLLKRFLDRALEALRTDARLQQAALKVMLALTDGNVRAGALSMKALKERLSGAISNGDIEEAVSWLARAEVRLVTPFQEKNVTLYELAHERIIPPLRRLVSKEVSDIEIAQQTLDRRVNEWIGNNRARRYLLTFKEWRMIKSNWTLITVGTQKEQKEDFVSHSKKRFIRRGVSAATVLLLLIGVFGWYIRYKQYREWYEQQPETKMLRAKEHLIELLEKNKDDKTTVIATLLLATLESEKDKELSEKLWQRITNLNFSYRRQDGLRLLAVAYNKLSRTDEALKRFELVRLEAGKKGLEEKISLLFTLEYAYKELPQSEKVLGSLYKVQQDKDNALEELRKQRNVGEGTGGGIGGGGGDSGPPRAAIAEKLLSLIEQSRHLSSVHKTVESLDRALQDTNQVYGTDREKVISSLIEAYVTLPDSEALESVNKVQQYMNKNYSQDKDSIPILFVNSFSKLPDIDKAMNGLDRVWEVTEENYPINQQVQLLFSFEKAYRNLPKIERVIQGFNKVRQRADKLQQQLDVFFQTNNNSSTSMNAVLIELAELFIYLSSPNKAEKPLGQARQFADLATNSKDKSLLLVKIATLYSELGKWDESIGAAQATGNEVDTILALSKILIIWNDTKNDTKYMDALQEMFQQVDEYQR